MLHNVPPRMVPVYMNACDAMLLTSQREGSPNVVKEAMASNLPAVATQVGDVSELFDGAAGYVACDRDPDALGGELAALLENGQPIDGRSAIVDKGLDLETVAGRLLEIYRQVLQ